MCGRYYIDPEGYFSFLIERAERKQFNMTGESTVSSGEVFPSSVIAVLANSRKLTPSTFPMRWGYNLRNSTSLLINARSETANSKPLFSISWQTRRCLIPMDYYFEWERIGGKTGKKYRINPTGQEPFYLAGLYKYEPGEEMPACVILTRTPSPEIEFIHDRMPVMFSESEKDAWLNPDADPAEVIKRCAFSTEYAAVS